MRNAILLLALAVSSSAFAQEASALAQEAPNLLPEPVFADYSAGATILRPTAHWSITYGDRTSAFGLGLQLIRFPNEGRWNLGAFADTQLELDGAWRSSAGFQAGYGIFGMRIGAAHRTEGDFAATTSLLIAKTVTMGPVGLVWHMGIPLRNYQDDQGERLRTRGVELGFMLQVGWGFTVQGERPPQRWCGCRHSCDVDAEAEAEAEAEAAR